MKTLYNYALGTWLTLTTMLGWAAMEDQADKLAPEPTVNIIWVWVFLSLFVGVCVAIGVGIYRADRKSKMATGSKD